MIRRDGEGEGPLPERDAILRAAGRVFAEDPRIVCAYLFGSRATGETGPLSDIDLAYYSRPPLSMMDEAELLHGLGQALGTSEVDLVNIRSMPLRVRVAVLEEGIACYVRTPEDAADLLEVARKEYIDFLPLEQEYEREFNRRLKQGGA